VNSSGPNIFKIMPNNEKLQDIKTLKDRNLKKKKNQMLFVTYQYSSAKDFFKLSKLCDFNIKYLVFIYANVFGFVQNCMAVPNAF